MTASDYIESALYHQREREMNLRNERHRMTVERRNTHPAGLPDRPHRGLVRTIGRRLTAIVTHAPVRG